MAEITELHDRLLADARSYDPRVHHRSLLGPFRDVLLLWRAKFMSYEQIAATLTRHGIKVSPAAVGVFCRNNLTRVELERVRRDQSGGAERPAVIPRGPRSADTPGSRRGPKVARDDY